MALTSVVAAGPVPAADPAAAFDLHGYSVVKLHRGINPVDVGVNGQSATVVIGRRENFNAHGFEVVTFYFTPTGSAADPSNPWPRLDLVDFFDEHTGPNDNDKESEFLPCAEARTACCTTSGCCAPGQARLPWWWSPTGN
jgi:hypothetical protein